MNRTEGRGKAGEKEWKRRIRGRDEGRKRERGEKEKGRFIILRKANEEGEALEVRRKMRGKLEEKRGK